jgi:hypothetical protein
MSLNNVKVKVNQLNGHLQTSAPLSLRNAVRDFSVEDIENVVIINRVDGSGLQYNSETQNYEIKLMSLDGGHF